MTVNRLMFLLKNTFDDKHSDKTVISLRTIRQRDVYDTILTTSIEEKTKEMNYLCLRFSAESISTKFLYYRYTVSWLGLDYLYDAYLRTNLHSLEHKNGMNKK